MTGRLVTASLDVLLTPSEPVSVEIEINAPTITREIVPAVVRDGWCELNERLYPVPFVEGLPIRLRNLSMEFLAIALSWQNGAKRAAQPVFLGKELIGDAAVMRKYARPLTNSLDLIRIGPLATRRSARVREVYQYVSDHHEDMLMRETEGRLGKVAIVTNEMIGRWALKDLSCLAWQFGFWYPLYRLVTDMGKGLFLVLGDLGGMAGEVIDRHAPPKLALSN